MAKISKQTNINKEKTNKYEIEISVKNNYYIIQRLENQIKLLKQGIIEKDKIEFDLGAYISSSDESVCDTAKYSSNLIPLDSPIIKIPDKIKMEKLNINLNKSANIPKLDLSSVQAKYNLQNNKVTIAEIQPKSNRSSTEYIEKLRFQIKVCKNTVNILKKKLEKYRDILDKYKSKISKLKVKNELLSIQLKKSNNSTNDGNSRNPNVNNTSMVNLIYKFNRVQIQV